MHARSAPFPARPRTRLDDPSNDQPLDWEVAVGTASRLIRPGPIVPRDEADRAVRDLREFSVAAETHVRELTGLGSTHPVLVGDVVDRPGWIRSAAEGLSRLTGSAMSTSDFSLSGLGDLLGGATARGAGVQAGVVLSYLGTKVLGQYDPFVAPPENSGAEATGRLLLVAPNIVAAQKALDVPPRDFQMWVCLHESTHRLQFTAVPWLRDHFARCVGDLLSQMDDPMDGLLQRLPGAVREMRSGGNGETSPGVMGLIEVFQNPEQRAALDRIMALSTLLEGHADHVMDAVGPRVVPSVHVIRRRFTERRNGGGLLDRMLRAMLGMDAKIAQYAKGAAFTRHVVDAVGMTGFNAVWTSPEHLPTRAEISAPQDWIARVHG